MSKGSGYVPIDKNLTQELNNLGRSFTRLEAMFSYTVDQDNGRSGSINGYAQLWNWSRNKTRKFLKEIRTVKGHSKNSRRTPDGHPVHFIDRALWISKDSRRTVEGQSKDSRRDTTNNPNPFPNPNPILKPIVEKPEIPFKEIIELLNEKSGKKFKHTSKETLALIRARWNQGFRFDDFRYVIELKCQKWLTDPKMIDYLRPQTLFGTKFESYRNEKLHSLHDIVSETTMHNIEVLKSWTEDKEREEIGK